jgi:hypothetical protein
MNDTVSNNHTAELASLVIEESNGWLEHAGNVLVTYSVHVPLHACAVGTVEGEVEDKMSTFMAPSATTGTLVATAAGGLVAAISPWTMEAVHDTGFNSSVQLMSCIAKRVPDVADSLSIDCRYNSSGCSSWTCDDDRNVLLDQEDAKYDLSAECVYSSHEKDIMCHVTVDFIVVATIIPKWAEGVCDAPALKPLFYPRIVTLFERRCYD